MPRHYPKPIPFLTDTELANFHSKVDKRGPDECWPWKAGKFNTGYGSFSVGGNAFSSHRLAYFLSTGNDPGTMCVLHKCDNRQCCNPSHYFLGTLEDNVVDMTAKGRAARGDGHGSRIHPESRPRGDNHFARSRPELLARGDRSGSRLHPDRVPKGENKTNAKLSDSKVVEIRMRRSLGETFESLSKRYNVTETAIRLVIKRKSWKHVP